MLKDNKKNLYTSIFVYDVFRVLKILSILNINSLVKIALSVLKGLVGSRTDIGPGYFENDVG